MLAPESWWYQSDCSGHMTVDEYMLWYLPSRDEEDIRNSIERERYCEPSKQLGYSELNRELRPNQRAAVRSF